MALKAMLKKTRLGSFVRPLRRQTQRGVRALYRAFGIAPHKPTETRSYWESRGKEYFEQVSSILSEEDPYYQAQVEFLRELEGIEWNSALEVGCGFGWHLRAVWSEYPHKRVVGTDFSLSQLQRGREYLRGEAILLTQADARHLPFADNEFDLVFTSGLLVCIHADMLLEVLSELERVARRSVVVLEYAREHMDSPVKQAIMENAAWHGHNYEVAFARVGLRLVKAFPFKAFASYPDRAPLSFFHGAKT